MICIKIRKNYTYMLIGHVIVVSIMSESTPNTRLVFGGFRFALPDRQVKY